MRLTFQPSGILKGSWREACGLRVPGARAYLVGGPVRDHLLRQELRDLDFAVSGDLQGWTKALAQRLGGEVMTYPDFGTAKVLWPGGQVDVAGLRREVYPNAGALPIVESTEDLLEDLHRRDFTVNAMAIPLDDLSLLIDPFGGRDDLKNRLLRILHSRSFSDDPTRILRGFRFAGRLGLSWEDTTAEALRHQLLGEGFRLLSSFRLGREIKRILREKEVLVIIRRLAEAGLLEFIHASLSRSSFLEALPLLNLESEIQEWWSILGGEDPKYRWLLRWAILQNRSLKRHPEWMDRLFVNGKELTLWDEIWGINRKAQSVSKVSNLEWWRSFKHLSPESLIFLAWAHPSCQSVVESWVNRVGILTLKISGEALIKMGMVPGPKMGEALQATLEERWLGNISADDERDYALQWYRNENSHLP